MMYLEKGTDFDSAVWSPIGKGKKFITPYGAMDTANKIGSDYQIFCLDERGDPRIEFIWLEKKTRLAK